MINAIIINFGHVNCACQKFKQVPLTAPLHVAHTQCGTTQRGGEGEGYRGCACEWDNIQLRKAGRQAAIRVSGIIKNASVSLGLRRVVHGIWARETGTGTGADAGGKAGNHLLCHFMAVAALFVAVAPAACRLLPLCLLFVSFFAWKITRTKNSGRRREGGGYLTLRHATTVSSNFQLESFAYLAPNERPLPLLLAATLAICSKCGQRILQLLHTHTHTYRRKKGNKSCR